MASRRWIPLKRGGAYESGENGNGQNGSDHNWTNYVAVFRSRVLLAAESQGGNSGIGHRVCRWDFRGTEWSGNHDRHAAPSAARVKKASFLEIFL